MTQKIQLAIHLMLGWFERQLFSSTKEEPLEYPALHLTDKETIIINICKYGSFSGHCTADRQFAVMVSKYQELILSLTAPFCFMSAIQEIPSTG